MQLSEFAELHGGVEKLMRRHFEYEKPVNVQTTGHGGSLSLVGSMVYTRALDFSKLGLSPEGAFHATGQGRLLSEMGIIPTVIICGIDQRNRDGGRFTAFGIKEVSGREVQFLTSPAVTYPHYCDVYKVDSITSEHGDAVVHKCLNGSLQLWSEPPKVFESRIMSAITAEYQWDGPMLFDLNFEQMVLLYYRLVKKVELSGVPDKGWCPKYGDTIVITNDGTVALFNAEFEFVE